MRLETAQLIEHMAHLGHVILAFEQGPDRLQRQFGADAYTGIALRKAISDQEAPGHVFVVRFRQRAGLLGGGR